jgi:hypothetical protein
MHHAAADELAEIRAEIARLRLREAALRAAILKAPDTVAEGRWTRVEVAERRLSVFDPARLPAEIRDDPRYWRERVTTAVLCHAAAPRALRPGWPIRRAEAAAAMH